MQESEIVASNEDSSLRDQTEEAEPAFAGGIANWIPASWWRWICPAIVAVAALVMVWWSWAKWTDPMIDFGRELYTPWQLLQGHVLYRDIMHFNGPLSPYVNALWFKIGGVNLWTLIYANLAITAVIVALLYTLLKEISGRLGATVGCLLFVTMFAFAQNTPSSNNNFVTPYAHEMTHGTLAILGALFFLLQYQRRQGWLWALLAGLALGLAFLTKAEIFLAALGATAVGFVGTFVAQRTPLSKALRTLVLVACGMVVIPLAAWGLLSLAMPADQALQGTLGSWPYTFKAEVRNSYFYRHLTGLDAPAENLQILATWCGIYLVVLGTAGVLAGAFKKASESALTVAIILGSIFIYVMNHMYRSLVIQKDSLLNHILQPLPVVMVLLAIVMAVGLWLRRKEPQEAKRLALSLAMIMMATLLLGKIILHVKAPWYGFALAMPATVIGAVAVIEWVPALLERYGRSGTAMRIVGLSLLVGVACMHIRITGELYQMKTATVGTDMGRFKAMPTSLLNEFVAAVQKQTKPDETVAVFPEGVMVNFQAQRANSTPYINFMPIEFNMFGEDNITRAFRQHPPDLICLATKNTEEYGSQVFGETYGKELRRWIMDNYVQVGSPIESKHRQFSFSSMILYRYKGK